MMSRERIRNFFPPWERIRTVTFPLRGLRSRSVDYVSAPWVTFPLRGLRSHFVDIEPF